MKSPQLTIYVLLLSVLFACSRQQTVQVAKTPESVARPVDPMASVQRAIAVIHPTKKSKVTGTVTFTREQGGIKIEARLRRLKPGKHGFHIHEWGDCSADDGSSAGGHFNPENQNHGAPTDSVRHVGDLGNIVADDNGVGYYERIDSVLSFTGAHSIIGRSVVIHEGADDLQSQPTGNAGARLGCGVIGIAKP
ncbi:MAG TPA: superoxide dismutase family protein [Balneolales bacterium]|nr:superoxide dismutase family protein [Balneolales bacterium]